MNQQKLYRLYLNLIQKNIRYFLNLGKGYQDAYAAYIRIKELLDLFGQDLFNEGDQLTIRPVTAKGQKHMLTTIELVG